MKGIVRILLLMAVVTVIVGCATYRLESPSYILSTASDAPRVYIKPYHFVGGSGVERLKGDWQRDEYIKSYLAKIMPVVFTDNPNDAVVTVVTQKIWINGRMNLWTNTILNGKMINTCADESSQLMFTDQRNFEQWANGDGSLMAEVIARTIKGQNITSAYAKITYGKNHEFTGIAEVKLE